MKTESTELKEVSKETTELVASARSAITTQAEYALAADQLKMAKAILKKLDGIFDPLIKSANEAVKAIRAEKTKHAEPIEKAEQVLRQAAAAWITEQERQKAVEEKRRREEAAAEEKRLKEEQDAESIFLEAIGLADTVSAPIAVIPAPVTAVDKSGIGFREVWKFEITDEAAIPREYMLVDTASIGKIVRAMKQLASIPGVRVYSEKTAVV